MIQSWFAAMANTKIFSFGRGIGWMLGEQIIRT
jgi:hypothetical protein